MKSMLSAPWWSLVLVFCVLSACNLFSNRRQSSEKATIPAGHWRLDSISAPEGKGELAQLALAMAAGDSANSGTDFYFTRDSVFYDFNEADTTRAAYDLRAGNKTLLIRSGNEADTLQFQFTKDSTLVLTGNDSVSLYLRRR